MTDMIGLKGRTANLVRKALKDIHVSVPVMALVSEMANAPGIPEEVTPEWLRKKWQSEVIYHSNGKVDLGGISTDVAFQNWVSNHLNNPRGLLKKSISVAQKEVRHDHLSYFTMTRWDQENAAAERMRGSPDNRISLLAGLWLSRSLHEQSKYLIEAIILYSTRISRNGSERVPPAWLLNDPDEIRCWDDIPVDCTPIWLEQAEQKFGSYLDNMSAKAIELGAAQTRNIQSKEVKFLRLRTQADRVALMKFIEMPGPLDEAILLGLNANEFTLAHRLMTNAILDGVCDLSKNIDIPVWRIFANYLPEAKNKTHTPTKNEVSIRLNNIFSLDAQKFLDKKMPILRRMGIQFSTAIQILSDWSVSVAGYAENTTDWHKIPENPEVGFLMYAAMTSKGQSH